MHPSATVWIRRMGVLGLFSMISYTLAVLVAPAAYPGYEWLAQAVSDLSAANAPSRELWNRLASLYDVCGLTVLMLCCVYVQGKLNRPLRIGVYAFTAMRWVSAIGYAYFPLTDSGFAGSFQDVMHMVVTAMVVVLSIVSLVLTMIGGFRKRALPALAVCASIALCLMFGGSIGIGIAPPSLFGLFERFSVFSAVCYTAVLGVFLMLGFPNRVPEADAA